MRLCLFYINSTFPPVAHDSATITDPSITPPGYRAGARRSTPTGLCVPLREGEGGCGLVVPAIYSREPARKDEDIRAGLSLLSDGQWYMNHNHSYNGVHAYISVWSLWLGSDGTWVDGVQASDLQGASGLHLPWPVNQGKPCIVQYMALKDALIARVGACTPDA